MVDRLFKILLVLLICLLAVVGYMYFLPGATDALATVHPKSSGLLKSVADQPDILGPGYLVGFFFVSIISLCVLVGMSKRGSLGWVGKWLVSCFICYLLVYTSLVWVYSTYEAGPNAAFWGGFPLPTAIMIYGIWGFPAFFITLFVVTYDQWFYRDSDRKTFQDLLKKAGMERGV